MKNMTKFVLLALLANAQQPALAVSIDMALSHQQRPANDKARDDNRKPTEILALVDIRPGMSVVDYIAGQGYYSELFARILDNQGVLYSVKGKLKDRELSTFSNIKVTQDLLLGDIDGRVDRIFTALNYHDLINKPEIDRRQLLNRMHHQLADGGYLIVIDHNASPGHGINDTKTKHRVESTFVLNEILAAGFELDRSLSILANPEDNFALDVWQDSTKGKTDRFVFRFKKKG
ncbi:class I SAM-dependent methyltransferase [Shewanella sedimentimangrovi]|uniref:Class I SAM-dependent methyltransferase n=1 Tax=Shewanella sedimentimangrovi TaxID=2814293 RepID=A0ABX7QY42_9GAMM|nr:class I SAM-dependent methyltransferase [Shewanella sedimentimangrovi]QSX35775.1 class I SAM-dependent methyltransferase [Shewanella sedimentimangrovi]